MQTMITPLKSLREEIKLTQRVFASEAKMPLKTYQNIEEGRNTTYSTAKHILGTLNRLRNDRDMAPVTRVEDLGLNIV